MKHKHFGTDGIRGRVGEKITREFVERVAIAATKYVGASVARPKCSQTICIGHDTRSSCAWIVDIFERTLRSAGIRVVNVGVVPTAGLSFLTVANGASLGIMITASHNPAEYNGIKFFDKKGRKVGERGIRKLEKLIDLSLCRGGNLPPVATMHENCPWENYLVEKFKPIFDKFCNKPKIVVDCANGSGAHVAEQVLTRLGFDFELVNNTPNGTNINDGCGAVHPDPKYGYCLDGDADRLVIPNVHGDRLIAALAVWLKCKRIVTTILFNSGVERFLKEKGIDVIRTDVGDRHIANALARRKVSPSFGGETSGHLIFPDVWHGGDGLVAILVTLHMVCDTGKTIRELTENIPLFPSVSTNIAGTTLPDIATLQKENPDYRIIVRASGTEPLVRIIVEGDCFEKCKKLMNEIN